MARVQRDHKVTICHYLWMGNHPHIILVSRDSRQCQNFYGELKKQLTDSIKRLLGLRHVNLWTKNGTSVIRYGDMASVQRRIAYLYANPARAHLVDTVCRYPGCSSWQVFAGRNDSIDYSKSILCPWVRIPMISKLPLRSLSPLQDLAFTRRIRQVTKKSHELIIHPNEWMKAFGVIDENEIGRTNCAILATLDNFEREAREERLRNSWKVKGAKCLAAESISLDYSPPTALRRIFVYALDPDIRKVMISQYQTFCDLCRKCYELWKCGDYSIEWPPGAFIPPMPPLMNCIAY